ncbi:DOMON domain-containing protein [Allorhodopirellula solitaria]|uniref:BNR/Asp-box repeat protein n=1 Tax=Allorhodopirellula solitaria TaxID=2527987 RepID=A0A5C5YHG1_9BACT|nr:hypothetical protein [Allorhodopirellula solitaria]TWT74151.1 BNR/Asp-box repeat protein [Allorhodopirellula solitaria]
MNRLDEWTWILILLAGLAATNLRAAEADRFDLDSISLQPSYISASMLRQSSCLRAVTLAPQGRVATAPGERVAIAVGDAGTLLRSTDAGQTWLAVETIHLDTPEAKNAFGRSTRRREQPLAIPFCDFTEVLWASPLDVIVVGGGYEPVTGISRGVCLLSRDAGQTWYLGDAHELPRLSGLRMGGPTSSTSSGRSQRELAPGVLEAVGDQSESSGVDHFYSYDGGQTWVEDIRVGDAAPAAASSRPGQPVSGEPRSIQTAAGRIIVQAISPVSSAGQLAVASHGRVWRRSDSASAWQAVRGQGRSTAVLFVAASPAEVPWSLIGRESLHENRRTAILLDRGNPPDASPCDLNRCRAAAAMLGISNVECVLDDSTRAQWIAANQPAVVVLDESLSEATERAWAALIEQSRDQPFSASTRKSAAGDGVQRIILTRRTARRPDPTAETASKAWYQSQGDPRWQRAWNHASVLRGSALLSGPGVLANDLFHDALMLAAPEQAAPDAIEVATLADMSGRVRRDVALAAGLVLAEGQNRAASETLSASNRRLQITTARMSQTRRLHDELFQNAATSWSPLEQTRLDEKIDQLLAISAPEDRTRMLWETMGVAMTSDSPLPQVREVLLSKLAQQGQPAAVRRWAALSKEALAASRERNAIASRAQVASLWQRQATVLGNVAESATDVAEEGVLSAADAGSVGGRQTLSPFQITPVSYQEEVAVPNVSSQPRSNTTSATSRLNHGIPNPILVPQEKHTQWQASRGLVALASPTSMPGVTGQRSDEENLDSELTARLNWDYHPVVMSARGIGSHERQQKQGNESQSNGDDTFGGDTQRGDTLGSDTLGSDSAESDLVYTPPIAHDRPLLDGRSDDDCWAVSDRWRGEGYQACCVADQEYLYFAVTSAPEANLRLSLDCDGDYFTALRFEIRPDGTRQAYVDGDGEISPVWYSASGADAGDSFTTEIAIARSSLPAPVCRIHVRAALPRDRSQWEVMPHATQWHPQRRQAAE